MRWLSLGSEGAYPAAIRALHGKSGVYAIRSRGGWLSSPQVLYVGESHSGNLKKTLVRHFQSWRRGKSWWVGAYAPSETDPGHTFRRGDVEVAFETCSRSEAVALQAKWIARLKPRYNVAGVDPDAAPF